MKIIGSFAISDEEYMLIKNKVPAFDLLQPFMQVGFIKQFREEQEEKQAEFNERKKAGKLTPEEQRSLFFGNDGTQNYIDDIPSNFGKKPEDVNVDDYIKERNKEKELPEYVKAQLVEIKEDDIPIVKRAKELTNQNIIGNYKRNQFFNNGIIR